MGAELYWLPVPPTDWQTRLRALAARTDDADAWQDACALAKFRLNFQRTNALASVLDPVFGRQAGHDVGSKPERLAILSSSTTSHLPSGIRVAALRRGLWVDVYEPAYGQYRQDVLDPHSSLHAFRPTAALFCLDASDVCSGLSEIEDRAGAQARLDRLFADLRHLWRTAKERLGCTVIQQTIMARHPAVVGSNEQRHAASPAAFTQLVNQRLREEADQAGIDLLSLDARVARDGLTAWHSLPFWLKAKQEVSIAAAPVYGDLVARLLAAKQGRVAKCCVLDLDNTLWGGVVGDDGVGGIVVGQGSAQGEAHAMLQAYARQLSRRGVLLAVCSKNEESIAREAFTSLPDMVLKEADISCFVANWTDKATNLRAIAKTLNIGLDALVFVDDNPVERDLVRSELPTVAVPELPEDIAAVPDCLADAGYFETTEITADDLARRHYYAADRRLSDLPSSGQGLGDYLAGLGMKLVHGPVETNSLKRVVQLINKTNQFNVTTRRYSEPQLLALLAEPGTLCRHFRLFDRFGDNGIIAVVIGRAVAHAEMEIDTWLMSCRVLGREVERATLNVVAQLARQAGIETLIGRYRPTPNNGLVRDLYRTLGFRAAASLESEATARLDLHAFVPHPTPIEIGESSS